jgi:hypothetical protein
MLDGRTPEKCADCEWFEKCHKITVAASLLSISDALDLIIQNGLADGRLKGYEELKKVLGVEPGKK